METNDDVVFVIEKKDLGERSNLPWVEKYRPSSLSELIAHEDIITICKNFVLITISFSTFAL